MVNVAYTGIQVASPLPVQGDGYPAFLARLLHTPGNRMVKKSEDVPESEILVSNAG